MKYHFDKKGNTFNVTMKNGKCFISWQKFIVPATPFEHYKRGWGYKIEDERFIKSLTGFNKGDLIILNDTAFDAYKDMQKAEEQKRQEQLANEIIEIEKDGIDIEIQQDYLNSDGYIIPISSYIIDGEHMAYFKKVSNEFLIKYIKEHGNAQINTRLETKFTEYTIHFSKEQADQLIASWKKQEEEKELKRKRKKEKEKEKLAILRAEKLAEAKATGKNVIIRKLGFYDGDARYPGRELGIITVCEIATPDGKIVKMEQASC